LTEKRQKNIIPEKIDTILSKLINSPELTHNLKEIGLKNLWSEIIDKKFIDCTQLLAITAKNGQDTALVGAASSVVVQELTFYKQKILLSLSKAGRAFGFNITGVIINTKYFTQKVAKNDVKPAKTQHFFSKKPSEEDLEKIEIPEKLLSFLQNTYPSFLETNTEKLMKTIIKDIKLQIWKKNNGFPCCEECGTPVNSYIENETVLCPACKYSGG